MQTLEKINHHQRKLVREQKLQTWGGNAFVQILLKVWFSTMTLAAGCVSCSSKTKTKQEIPQLSESKSAQEKKKGNDKNWSDFGRNSSRKTESS